MHRLSNLTRNPWRTTILSAALVLTASILASAPAVAQAAPSRFIYELCDPSLPGGNPPALNYAVNLNELGPPFLPTGETAASRARRCARALTTCLIIAVTSHHIFQHYDLNVV